ncbi:hypothetical protein K438DRAFT_1757850 [Mycena galopus ATCC 62051]|nr:hypothetical protein K438DRAFT_1757850 [Mycena galopus ATCC 62051]
MSFSPSGTNERPRRPQCGNFTNASYSPSTKTSEGAPESAHSPQSASLPPAPCVNVSVVRINHINRIGQGRIAGGGFIMRVDNGQTHLRLELPHNRARLREDRRTVAEWVRVEDGDGRVERGDAEHAQDGAEDLSGGGDAAQINIISSIQFNEKRGECGEEGKGREGKGREGGSLKE